MKRWVIASVAALGVTTLGALGGCEIVAVTTLNLIETTKFTVDGEILYMHGEINSKTDEQFEAVIAANPQITTVVECVVPGSLDDDTMIALSYRVRELGLNTHLTATSDIASGGVDFFLSGVKRSMETGAQIGVHSWSDGFKEARDFPQDAPEHEANRKYIEDMLGDDAFYWFTIYAASADDIYQMTADEIAEFDLVNLAAPETNIVCVSG